MRNILCVLGLAILLAGCNTAQLEEDVALQRQTIDTMQGSMEKMQNHVKILQDKVKSLKQEVDDMKKDLKKVSPDYLEGTVQEGNS